LNIPVSIIIPCKEVDKYTQGCIEHCLALNYQNFRIILLPDNMPKNTSGLKNVRIVPTGPLTPGGKRNIGVKNSKEEICAFIDSDAYPTIDWLSNAINYFQDSKVAAVGGPGVTPKEDSAMQRASGHVLSSFMIGQISIRYKSKKVIESDDIHSCNFIVRKEILEDVGGWNEKFWPGEDSLVCLAIKKSGKKMIEASDVVVYHHRRPLFKEHITQVSRFGLHRGFFAKKFRGNSRKITYFIPSIAILMLITGLAATLLINSLWVIMFMAISAYFILGLIAVLCEVNEIKLIPIVFLGIITTHFAYGVSFFFGLTKKDLEK
jgi:cellulose synthase/poly-beta-1,6-N-acetylglucosamine synthase-like glycosyltransferase